MFKISKNEDIAILFYNIIFKDVNILNIKLFFK